MDKESDNLRKNSLFYKGGMDWKPIFLFYVKATSWIILPLVFAIFTGKYVSKTIGSQVLFFIFIMVGFGITCFGIYKEIKSYKKKLDSSTKDNILDNFKNDN